MKMPTAPRLTRLNAWVTSRYIPSSCGLDSTIAPCAGARSTAWLPHPPLLPRDSTTPSLMTVSKIVPTTWNELSTLGPASRTNTRTRPFVATSIGTSLYWLATPLNTTKSGAGLAAAALAGDEGDFLIDLRQAALRLNDDHAEHAVRDVMQRGRGAAVIHPDPGVVRREGVGERAARLDLDHLMAHRGLAGVEVDRVGHLGLVRQVDPNRITEVHADRGTGNLPAERPRMDDEALGDGDVLVDDRQVDVVDGALHDRRRGWVEADIRWGVRVGDRRGHGGAR